MNPKEDQHPQDRVLSEEMNTRMRATEKLRMLGQLSASIAHDLKNVIGIISFSAESLSNKTGLDDDVKEYADVIHRNGQQAAQIVGDLMEFTKTRELVLQPKDVNEVIESCLKMITTICRSNKITLQKSLTPQLPPVSIVPHELKSAFLNLFLNAIEAMPQGGTLTVESRNHSSGKGVQVSIKDTGVGITEEDIAKMGQPFFTTKPEGSGFGVYVTKQILDFHKANLQVLRNQDQKGITILISFPPAQ